MSSKHSTSFFEVTATDLSKVSGGGETRKVVNAGAAGLGGALYGGMVGVVLSGFGTVGGNYARLATRAIVGTTLAGGAYLAGKYGYTHTD
jgi:hypothetical protein